MATGADNWSPFLGTASENVAMFGRAVVDECCMFSWIWQSDGIYFHQSQRRSQQELGVRTV